CGMMVMVPFLLGGTFFLDETTAKPARPLRSGFLFARGEHRRRPRVELTATRVGSTAMPRVLSRPSPEGPKLAPAQGHSYRAGAFLCRPPPRHLSWHEQISPDPRVTPTRQHNTRPAYPGQRPVSRARDSVNTTPYLCGSMLRPARKFQPARESARERKCHLVPLNTGGRTTVATLSAGPVPDRSAGDFGCRAPCRAILLAVGRCAARPISPHN